MPPRIFSRYSFSEELVDPVNGRRILSIPVPFRFRAFDDNQRHVVVNGDTLWHLAGRYFKGFSRPCGLWWIIAEFNGIYDPTLALEAGSILIIPSLRTVHDSVFSQDRRLESE